MSTPLPKLCVVESGLIQPKPYFVAETGRTIKWLGYPLYKSFAQYEDAQRFLEQCERDPEYRWNQTREAWRRPMRNMSKYEVLVLVFLFEQLRTDNNVHTFNSLSEALGITRAQAKRACRALKQRGMVDHECYFDDDGMIGGSGYSVSVNGCGYVRGMPGSQPKP